MKGLLNNLKNNLNNNRQKTLLFILASFALVELLALIYASNIINLNKRDKYFLDESKSWDYYTLATYLSQNFDHYDEEKTIKSFGKYLILDPKLIIANQVLSEKYPGNNSNDRSNICPTPTIDQEQIKNFNTLRLGSDIAYIKRGKIRFQLEDYQGSINDFKKAIDLNNKNKNTLSKSIALAYFELGNPKDGDSSQDIEAYFLRERTRPGFLSDELKSYSSLAIDLNPNFAHAYYLRGYLQFIITQSDVFWNMGRGDTQEINIMINMGIFDGNNIYRFREIINDLTQAIRNDPFFYKNYPLKKITPCPVFSDEYSTLIETLAAKIKINPNEASLYHKRALIYLESNNHSKAIKDLNKVIQLNSSNNSLKALAYYSLWLAHYKRKDYQKALENINQVIKIYPDFADLYAIRGLTYYDFSKLSKNRKDLEKVIEDCNHAIKLHEELLKKLNSKEDSGFLYQKPHANAYFIRGLAYYDLGNQTQALSDYLKALDFGRGSMWPSLMKTYRGGGVREIQVHPEFPPRLSNEN